MPAPRPSPVSSLLLLLFRLGISTTSPACIYLPFCHALSLSLSYLAVSLFQAAILKLRGPRRKLSTHGCSAIVAGGGRRELLAQFDREGSSAQWLRSAARPGKTVDRTGSPVDQNLRGMLLADGEVLAAPVFARDCDAVSRRGYRPKLPRAGLAERITGRRISTPPAVGWAVIDRG